MGPESEAIFAGLRSLLGTVVGTRYRVDELVAVGGMGAIFRARHLRGGRDIALKVLRPDRTDDDDFMRRFEREATLSSRLDHPNCIRVLEFGRTPEGMRYLAMELLEGEDLTRHLGRPMPLARAFDLAGQIFRGLEHAHARGVTHRDVKPANIVVVRDAAQAEVVKLCDFGVAKIAAGPKDAITTRVGTVFGTPAYMSPEQATGRAVDARSDLYSAGVILYEMLRGAPPFDHPDPLKVVRMQISHPPAALPRAVPLAVAALVGRLLSKMPDARFQSAAEVVVALDLAYDLASSADPSLAPRRSLKTPMQPHQPASQRTLAEQVNASTADGDDDAILRAFDASLKRVLASATPDARDNLNEGLAPDGLSADTVEMRPLEADDARFRSGD